MTETVEIPALLPALPEIVLAIGAMLLLLVLTGLIVVLLPAGKLVTFGGSFVVDGFARFLKLLALAGSAAAIVMSSNYLARELMSLALYVVAAIDRDSVRSTEAGLKYFVLGALSSGMLLYGASLVYGFTGTG